MDVQGAEDIVVVRPVRDATRDVSSWTEHVLPACIVAPSTSAEDVSHGDKVTDDYSVYVLADADVWASDRIRRPSDPVPAPNAGFKVRGPWMVVGTPAKWTSPFSEWSPGSVIRIRREGGG